MTSLILDTSQETSLVALFTKNTLVDADLTPHENNLSHSLAPTVRRLLKKNNLKPSDLCSVFVGVGPGSYTGTRIAVSFGECLALALNCPLIPFCSLLAFIDPNVTDGPFAFLFPSKQDTCFILEGALEKGNLSSPPLETLISQNELAHKLNQYPTIFHAESSKKINLPFLLSYLNLYPKSPTFQPKIIYLHDF